MSGSPSSHLVRCRPEFSAALRDELAEQHLASRLVQPGLVACTGLPERPLIFEHQRMPEAGWLPAACLKPISESTWSTVMGHLATARHRWTLHVWALPGELQARAEGIAQTLLRLARRWAPGLDDLERPPHRAERMEDALVLQLCLTPEGLWHSTTPMHRLSCRQPGGAVRMKDDPRAPSRSYLKIEEAFYRLQAWPQPGQRAVDLGAAPGGWTLAFAKRGCQVVAVDNGPLKLPPPEPGWGNVDHRRVDGLTFPAPTACDPVDWLAADMLVAPGRVADLLERWLQGPAMRRFVINVKLPEGPPLIALKPLRRLLERATAFRTEIRHLYHDREEVTLLGGLG